MVTIVLIDEVDLRLHPRWQQVVLLQLQNIFSSTQFIVTTHSPQVLTSVEATCIRKLVPHTNPDTGAQTVVAENVSLPNPWRSQCRCVGSHHES